MKKLMTILSVTAVAAFAVGAANGDTLNTGTGFETDGSSPAYIAGEDLDTAKDDAGAGAGHNDFAPTWAPTNLEEGVAIVTAYGGEGAAVAADVATATGVAVADLGSNYLKLDGAPLITRYAQPATYDPNNDKVVPNPVNIGGGLYIDTLVQFTAADPETPPTPDVDGGDKLCIWLADNEEDPTQCTLMVTAGFVDSDDGYTIVATNYETTTKLANNSWHRLQVKVLAGIDSEDTDMLADGFVVIIDGSNTVATTTCPIDSEVISEYTLNARAQRYMTVGNYSLFPSLVRKGRPGAGEITSLSFQGSGAVDNLTFTQGADIDPIVIAAADMPKAVEGLKENGNEQYGVEGNLEDEAYVFGGVVKATVAGTYTATATLVPGYVWTDGSSAVTNIEWTIAAGGEPGADWADTSDAEAMADIAGKTAQQAYGITGAIGAADATQLTVWATGVGNVAFSAASSINTDCFLLNIANNSSAADIEAAEAEFKVSIEWNDTKNDWDITTLPVSKTYNGTLTIKGSTDLTVPKANWDAKAAGDTFFYATLGL